MTFRQQVVEFCGFRIFVKRAKVDRKRKMMPCFLCTLDDIDVYRPVLWGGGYQLPNKRYLEVVTVVSRLVRLWEVYMNQSVTSLPGRLQIYYISM